jgi:hypothetical protein
MGLTVMTLSCGLASSCFASGRALPSSTKINSRRARCARGKLNSLPRKYRWCSREAWNYTVCRNGSMYRRSRVAGTSQYKRGLLLYVEQNEFDTPLV